VNSNQLHVASLSVSQVQLPNVRLIGSGKEWAPGDRAAGLINPFGNVALVIVTPEQQMSETQCP